MTLASLKFSLSPCLREIILSTTSLIWATSAVHMTDALRRMLMQCAPISKRTILDSDDELFWKCSVTSSSLLSLSDSSYLRSTMVPSAAARIFSFRSSAPSYPCRSSTGTFPSASLLLVSINLAADLLADSCVQPTPEYYFLNMRHMNPRQHSQITGRKSFSNAWNTESKYHVILGFVVLGGTYDSDLLKRYLVHISGPSGRTRSITRKKVWLSAWVAVFPK